MKTLLIALAVIFSLTSCTTSRNGCNYHRGKAPKFTADIQVQGVLKKVLSNKNGKAVFEMYLPVKDTTVFVYYGYYYGIGKKRFEIGSKWTLKFDSRDTAAIRKSIVTLNS